MSCYHFNIRQHLPLLQLWLKREKAMLEFTNKRLLRILTAGQVNRLIFSLANLGERIVELGAWRVATSARV